jgi:hypothetical protein
LAKIEPESTSAANLRAAPTSWLTIASAFEVPHRLT